MFVRLGLIFLAGVYGGWRFGDGVFLSLHWIFIWGWGGKAAEELNWEEYMKSLLDMRFRKRGNQEPYFIIVLLNRSLRQWDTNQFPLTHNVVIPWTRWFSAELARRRGLSSTVIIGIISFLLHYLNNPSRGKRRFSSPMGSPSVPIAISSISLTMRSTRQHSYPPIHPAPQKEARPNHPACQ